MRNVIIWSVATAATIGLLALPLWAQGSYDVSGMTPQAELQFTERAVDAVRRGDTKATLAAILPEYRPTDTSVVTKLTTLFPKGTPHVSVTQWRTMAGTDRPQQTQIELVYDYGSAGLVHVLALLSKSNGQWMLAGLNIRAFPASAAHVNDFRFPVQWSDVRWLLLALAATFDIATLGTLAMCLLNGSIRWRWRWLWLLFIASGFGRLNIDWVTLQYQILPITFLMPPAGFYRFLAYGSWVLSLSLPAGVVVYWLRVRHWQDQPATHHLSAF